MKRLSSRERTILVLMVGTLFVSGNFVVLSSLYQRYSDLTHSLSSKQKQLHNVKLMFSQRELWATRDGWLNEKQPKLTNRDQAGVKLLQEVETVAKGHDVLVENQRLNAGIDTDAPYYQAVSVEVETSSSWPDLINFLHSLQQPERFIVFQNASMEVDAADATKMRGKFTIAKWYAR